MSLPDGWQLPLPGGIDAASTRALLALLEERFGALPIERVLVWHVASVVEDALPHLAEGLGIADLAFIDAPPREFIGQGVSLMRRRGTPAAVEDALAAIGYGAGVVELEEDTRIRYDGRHKYSGRPLNYGGDGRWVRWRVWLDANALTVAQLREIWDVCELMNRRTRPFVVVVRASDGVLSVYRTREGITSPSHDPGALIAPSLVSLSRSLLDPVGGGPLVTVKGTGFDASAAVDFGGSAATEITIVSAIELTCRAPAHAADASVPVTVTTDGGTSNALSVEYWTGAGLAGCLSWHDTFTGVTVTSGAVSAWSDRGPSGDAARHFAQATSSKRPAWDAADADFGGHASVAFDGVDDLLRTGNWASDVAQPVTWYLAMRVPTASLPSSAYYFDGGPSGAHRQAWLSSGGIDVIYAGAFGVGGQTLPTSHVAIVCVVFDGGTSAVYVDSAAVAVASGNAGADSLQGITLAGRHTDEGYAAFRLAALGTFAGAHDASARAAIMTRLATRYAGE